VQAAINVKAVSGFSFAGKTASAKRQDLLQGTSRFALNHWTPPMKGDAPVDLRGPGGGEAPAGAEEPANGGGAMGVMGAIGAMGGSLPGAARGSLDGNGAMGAQNGALGGGVGAMALGALSSSAPGAMRDARSSAPNGGGDARSNGMNGRGSHPSTFQLNLSRFCH
jgi:hypothetical protein